MENFEQCVIEEKESLEAKFFSDHKIYRFTNLPYFDGRKSKFT